MVSTVMNGALTATSVQTRACFRPTAARTAAPRSTCLRVHALAQVSRPSRPVAKTWPSSKRHLSFRPVQSAAMSRSMCDDDLPTIRISTCHLLLQDQRTTAQAGASALVASAAALILALPGPYFTRDVGGARVCSARQTAYFCRDFRTRRG